MEVRRMSPTTSELYHHGIKGQRWGIRRFQNYDGSLIGSHKRKSKNNVKVNSEVTKKANSTDELTEEERKRKRNKKIAAAVAIASGVTLAAAVTYVAHNKYVKENVDQIINSDNLKRVSLNEIDNSNLTDRAYYSNGVLDNIKYKGIYGTQVKNENATWFGMIKPDIYQKTFKADNVKVASNKKARETFFDLYNKDEAFKKDVNEQLDLYREVFTKGSKQSSIIKKANFKAKTGKLDTDVYDAFNITLSNRKNAAGKKFYDTLKSHGYDAIHDINDQKYSGYNAGSAKIIFNGSKVTQTAAKKLSDTEVNKALVDASVITLAQSMSKYAVPAATTAGIAGGAAGYVYNDKKEKENSKGRR